MPLHSRTRKIASIALWVAAASVLYFIENRFFPTGLPWRIGIANIVTLITLSLFGVRISLGITIARCIIGSMLGGQFLSASFFMGLSGGIVSTLVMAVLLGRFNQLGPVGVSIIGALAHNLTQVALVYLVFARTGGIVYYLPWLWILSLSGGLICGILYMMLIGNINYINRRFEIYGSS